MVGCAARTLPIADPLNVNHLCLEQGKTGIWAIAFHPHKLILAAAADGSAILSNLENELTLNYQHQGNVNLIQFSLDGSQLFTCSTAGLVKTCDV